MRLPLHAERSRSMSAQETKLWASKTSVSFSPPAPVPSARCGASHALITSDGVAVFIPQSFQRRGSVFKNSKMPVSSHWCSPKVSKSMYRFTQCPPDDVTQEVNVSALSGKPTHDLSEKRKATSSARR